MSGWPDGRTERVPSVVWCFEHCMKSQQERLRTELKQAATMFGCSFTCHKKSMGFLSWLEGREGRILLLADWREAKPIMEELGRRQGRHDIIVCVVGQSDKMFRRAVDWATKQISEIDIIVSSSFSRQNIEDLVARHWERSSQHQAVWASRSREVFTMGASASSWSPSGPSDGLQGARAPPEPELQGDSACQADAALCLDIDQVAAVWAAIGRRPVMHYGCTALVVAAMVSGVLSYANMPLSLAAGHEDDELGQWAARHARLRFKAWCIIALHFVLPTAAAVHHFAWLDVTGRLFGLCEVSAILSYQLFLAWFATDDFAAMRRRGSLK
ncbi:unnamed protein product, partial [Symbiodinium microadriaticum]